MRIDSWLKIGPDDGLNYDLLMTKLTVPNPEFQSRVQLGYSTNGVRRFDNLYQAVGNELWVPRALAEKYAAKGKNVVDCMSDGHEVDFKSRIRLGPNEKRKEKQEPFVDALTEAMKNSYGAIGQAEAGFGKTVCALEVVARLGRTTAVLVHKEFLMNQWAERVMECYDIDESEIGFVQQDVCDYEGKKIVMIMVQSLLAREYPEEMFKYFGTVVVDEVHRFGAVEFRRAITMFPGRYRLGVTATPRRTDGLEKVFFWHIGDIASVGAKRRLKPRIEMVRTNVKPSDLELRRMRDFRGELTMNKVLDWLVTSEERNRLIVQLLLKAARSGRKVLLLSGRREHLNVLRHMAKSEMAKSGKQFSTGFYVGGMTDEERGVSATKDLIFGCVPEDTECLTLDGWKMRDELNIGELVASYDLETEKIKYVPLEDVVVYQHEGKMLRVDRKEANILMTVDHRNVVLRPKVKDGKKEWVEEIVRGYDLTKEMKLRLRAPVEYPEGAGIGEDLAELIGWIIAEGSYVSGNRARSIQLWQNDGRKAERIDTLLQRTGLKFRRNEYRKGEISWYIDAEDAVSRIRCVAPEKKLNKFLVSLPLNEAERLFNGLVGGDGHRRPDGNIVFRQKDEDTVDWFMILALRLGWRPLKRRSDSVWRVHLSRKEFIGLYDGKDRVKEVEFSGKVWCPKTEYGTWVARRNGSVFVTGNTYQMAAEGLDIPELDTLFLTTPRGDIEQSVGRILRTSDGKKEPVVVDFVDYSIGLCIGLSKKRLKQYQELGYVK